jgi:purine-binding chemotaxis protein CheW
MTSDYFVFTIETRRYALELSAVEKVIRAVEIIPLPDSPDSVIGLINFKGKMIPVFNIRKKLRVPERGIEPDDRIIISRISGYHVAFIADTVEGMFAFSPIPGGIFRWDNAEQIFPEMEEFIKGVAEIDGSPVIVYDSQRLLEVRIEK